MKFSSKGSLSDEKFIEILKDAGQSGLTGMIRVENGPIIKVIYFQKGAVSFASSNEKSDRLTEVLQRAGKLTPEQVLDAQSRLKPNVSLGKTLVELGYISAKDLLWGARAQVDGILHQLLFWSQGKYQLQEGTLPREIIHLNLPVPSIIYEGIMKTQNRDWILQHIGSPEAIYAVATDFDEQTQKWKLPVSAVTSKLNGRRTLHDIAQMSGVDTFELCKTVVALEYLDLARPIQDEPLQMALNTPEKEQTFEMAIEDQPPPTSMDVAKELGQVLQIPTVADLKEEAPTEVPIQEEAVDKPDVLPVTPQPQVESVDEDPVKETEQESAEISTAPEEPSAKTVEPAPAISPVRAEPVEHVRVPMQDMVDAKSEGSAGSSRLNREWVLAIVLILAAGAYYYLLNKNDTPVEPPAVKSLDRPVKPSENNAAPVSEPTKSPEEQAPENEEPAVSTAEAPPLSLLKDGKLPDAAKSWSNELAKNKNAYSIQVVIACQEKTVLDTYRLLNYSEQIIVLPVNFKGQDCYRVLYGQFSSRQFAEAAIKTLPEIFVRQSSPASVVALSKVLS